MLRTTQPPRNRRSLAAALALVLGAVAPPASGQTAAAPQAAAPAPPAAVSPPAATTPPPAPYVFPAHDSDLLALNPEIEAYFAARVDNIGDEVSRLREIVGVILEADGLHFTYDPEGNYSAAETFRRRHGNCVSFSLLAIAVVRSYGFHADFCEVNTFPRWDRHGNLITEIRHINVRVRTGGALFDLDLLPGTERMAPISSVDLVSDARAFAHFYNNLAVQRIAAGDDRGAGALFDRALAADPTASFVWANKGGDLMRAGNYPAAESCLTRAVRLNSSEHTALTNLADLYTLTGRTRDAAALQKKVERYQLRNPYYLELLAQNEFDRGEFRDADTHLHRAISIKDDEPEFYELRIQVAQKLGWTRDAERWSAKLQELRSIHPTEHFDP
ncbi:MAG TPA: tetratricopeptide repeat protein [Opitutaceae bacterium]|nr:tetratricopeptide repeat protein [Opitutaceae bacterium]